MLIEQGGWEKFTSFLWTTSVNGAQRELLFPYDEWRNQFEFAFIVPATAVQRNLEAAKYAPPANTDSAQDVQDTHPNKKTKVRRPRWIPKYRWMVDWVI